MNAFKAFGGKKCLILFQLLEQPHEVPVELKTECLYSALNGSISMFLLFDTMMDDLFTEQHWWPENLIFMPANP